MNERRRMMQETGMTNAALATACNLSERTVTRWVSGNAEPETHRKIMHALNVKPRKMLRALLDDAWGVLLRECPDFCQAIARIADSPLPSMKEDNRSVAEANLLDIVCDDVERDHGSRVLSPVLSKRHLDRCAVTHEQLDRIESFFGCILLFIVKADHQFSINVDGEMPMTIRGISEGDFVRLLVHCTHPNELGPMPITLVNGEIQSSPNNLFFKDPVSAEVSSEEASLEFLYHAAERLEPAMLARAFDEHADKPAKVALMTIRNQVLSDIEQRNRKDNHLVGIGGLNTPKAWTSHLKDQTLPDLRVAQLESNTDESDISNNIFFCNEYSLRSLIVQGVESILERRQELESQKPRKPGETPMKDSSINITDSSIGNISTGEHATNTIGKLVYADEMRKIRSLLSDVETELQASGQTDLAAKADELTKEEDSSSLIQRAGELVQSIEKPASAGARLLGLAVKLKSALFTLAAATGGA